MKAAEFFTLPPSLAAFAAHFPPDVLPWEWLRQIGPALAGLKYDAPQPPLPPGVHVEGLLWIHPTVKFASHATLIGPAYIGARTEIKPGAFFRGNVIVGEGCVLGNACEYKNCLLMDDVKTPHYNYVGDSILGNGAHLGAGAICSNYRLDHRSIQVRIGDAVHPTGLRKFGAIIGEAAEVGCNTVLNPGTLLGPRALVGPAMAFGGYLAPDHLARVRFPVIDERRQ